MNRDLVLYFLLLLLPVFGLPFAAHRLLVDELARGRETGTACLQAKAEALAWRMRAERLERLPAEPRSAAVQAALVDDASGGVVDGALPRDGRCRGCASLAPEWPGRSVVVTWAGVRSVGALRARRLMRAEAAVFVLSAFIFLIGLVLVLRAVLRARADARRQLDYVADFSHRLKTPLTSISLCAELTRSGRLNGARVRESTGTIVDEAAKLDVLVDEVLAYIKDARHG